MDEIEICLNCTEPVCYGNYPECRKGRKETPVNVATREREIRLKDVGNGNAVLLVCLLAKLGHNRKVIAKICNVDRRNISSLLNYGVKQGIITQREADASRVNKSYVRGSRA